MSKKTENWQVALAAVGIAAYAYFSSGEKSGSESGGVQIPSVFPTGGNGSVEPATVNNYNFSFPDMPGIIDGSSKKENTVASTLFTAPSIYEAAKNTPVSMMTGVSPHIDPSGVLSLSTPGVTLNPKGDMSLLSKKDAVIAAKPTKQAVSTNNISSAYQAAATKAYGSNVISQAYGGTPKKATYSPTYFSVGRRSL